MGKDETKVLANLSETVRVLNAEKLESQGKTRLERLAESIEAATPRGLYLTGSGTASGLELDYLHESDLQLFVRDTCGRLGFKHFHAWNSQHSEKGYPDSTLVGDRPANRGRLIFAELKTGGKCPTSDQIGWLDKLAATPAEVYLWREHDLDEIVNLLLGNLRYQDAPSRWTRRSAEYL